MSEERKKNNGNGNHKKVVEGKWEKSPVKNAKKPWEMMQQGGAKKLEKKPVKEFKSFLYLLPKRTSAKDLAKALSFLSKEQIEVWEDECVLEISAGEAVITFEDIRDSLEKEDEKVLNSLRMKQVLACDYESTDAELVQKIMQAFIKAFQGKIGSDTEDFQPFMNPEEI